MSAPLRLALVGDDLARAAAAAAAAGLGVVRRDPQLVLCHGGDGTLLRAHREWPAVPKVPVRVAARARLCPEHALERVLAALAAGKLRPESLPLLEASLGNLRLEAVNDVVLRNESPATAVRLRVHAGGSSGGEFIGDGVVCATPFGSTGYYRSITRRTFARGLGLAFNNATEPLAPIELPQDGPVEVEVLRGPAVLVYDNDPRSVPLREGQRIVLRAAGRSTEVLGLDALRCQLCRKSDGSAFNPH